MPNYSCEDFYSLGALKMNYYSDRYETQIHIQTQIRENFVLFLATNDFL